MKEVINNSSLTCGMIPNLVDISNDTIKENLVKRGDIILNRTSETTEEIGIISVYLDDEPIVFGGFVIRGRERGKVLYDLYKKYCFKSKEIRDQMISYASRSIRKNIGQSNLKDIYMACPCIEEQQKIANFLDLKCSQFDSTIEKQKQLIEKLKSAKQSLISEVVTGKIEVF